MGHRKKHQALLPEACGLAKEVRQIKRERQVQFHYDKCLDRGKHWVCENIRRGPEKAF